VGPVHNLLGSAYKKPFEFGLTKESVDTNDKAVAVLLSYCVVSSTALPCYCCCLVPLSAHYHSNLNCLIGADCKGIIVEGSRLFHN
jgi:hypothetical protein